MRTSVRAWLLSVLFVMLTLTGAQTALAATITVPSAGNPTIQSAVLAAAAGDTIEVAAGEYMEIGQIVVDKDLTIVGADKATTIIKPAQGTTGDWTEDSSAWILVNPGVTFNLSKVTLDGTGQLICNAIISHGHGAIDGCTIKNVAFNQSGPDYSGCAVALYTSDMAVSDNVFTGIGREGVFVSGLSTATISGNTYVGKGAGNWLDYAFEVGHNSTAVISGNTISGNTGVAEFDGSTSEGIIISSYYDVADQVTSGGTIIGNTITGNSAGIAVGYDETDKAVVHAHGNVISGNVEGAYSTSALATFDATGNYWGAASGPKNATTNILGTGDAVSDNVVFKPFAFDDGFEMKVSAAPASVQVLKGAILSTPPTAAPASASNVAVTLSNSSGVTHSVKVVVEADAAAKAHVQAWFKDSVGNWYDTIADGFGPPAGFAVPAGYSATTDFYVMADEAGTYTATFKVVDATTNEVLSTSSITSVVGEFVVTATPSSVPLLKGALLSAKPTVAPLAASNVSVTLANTSAFTHSVKVVVEADAAAKAHVQAWFKDSVGNWYDTIADGFGPPAGFAVPAGYSATTDFYVMADEAGTYTATFKVVDATTNEVLSTSSITSVVGEFVVTATPSSVPLLKGALLSAKPTVAPLAASNVSVTLANTSAFTHSVKVVVEADAAAKAHVQAWFKDSVGNWYDTIADGFGPPAGFAVPAGYSATTEFYVMADKAGTYTATFKVVDATTDEVLSTSSITSVVGEPVVPTYTVTFKDFDGSVLATKTVNHGSDATAPSDPTRTGYTFAGWDKAFGNITGDLTVTATYTVITHTVTFKDFDGSVLATKSVSHGSDATAPTAPTRTGYTFAGWDKAFGNITGDLTVTATYTVITYTVTFKDFDGSVLATKTVNHGSDATAPSAPTRTGYTFAGWDKAFGNVTGDLTATAKYTAITYTVTFKDFDGSVLATKTVTHGSDATAPSAPTRTGYTFAGWDKAFGNVTGDLTVTAEYTADAVITHIVTFKDFDGSVLAARTVNHGSDATAPSAPTRTGYTFDGWDKAFGNITGDLTVTAKYTADAVITHTVTGTAGANGTMSILGATSVSAGSNLTVIITPDTYYAISDVLVDGVSSAGAIASGSHTFTNVSAHHTISVTFVRSARIWTGLSFKSTPTTSYHGHEFVFAGKVSPSSMGTGTRITIWMRKSGQEWRKLGTVYTNVYDNYSYTLHNGSRAHGTYYVRVKYAGNSVYASSYSPYKKIYIK